MQGNARTTKSRGWCFTINNPGDFDRMDVERLSELSEYYVCGNEVGDEGTPHMQGFVRFKHAVSFARVKSLLSRAHIEAQKGTSHEAAEYCKKDGDFREYGVCPGVKRDSKERWAWIIEKAEAGDMESIKSEYPGDYLRLYDKLLRLRRRGGDILDDIEHEWWYGTTGTGKSRKVWEDYPDHYAKQLNKWWDGYENEEVVVIEEWCPKNECTASYLKIWADRYPFPVEVKGGNMQRIRPRKIIVTSNYSIDQCFERAEDRDPIKRRFKQVHFPVTPFMDLSFLNEYAV